MKSLYALKSTHVLFPQSSSEDDSLSRWTTLASNVTKAADLAGFKTRFWGGVFAGPAWTNLTGFTAANLLDSGILASEPGSFITAISQHLYS